jgi:hypothetical protein
MSGTNQRSVPRASFWAVMKTIKRKSSRRRPSEQSARGPARQRTGVRVDRKTRDAIIRLVEALGHNNERFEPDYLETCASDPIPENSVGLSDAFDRIMDAAEKNPDRLKLDDDDRRDIRRGTESDLKQFIPEEYSVKDIDEIALGKEANVFIRKCLTAGELVAHVRDPETGQILQLPRKGWNNLEFYPGELGWLLDNHVHPGDPLNPGPPEVMVRGMARPVFFLRDGFDLWFERTFGVSNRRGRKRGSGFYAQDDEPLLMKMHELIADRQARNTQAACSCTRR